VAAPARVSVPHDAAGRYGRRMLSHLRVLDLTDGGATIAGRLFADLGAEVILVEPPGGIGLRREGPFVADRPGPESSLSFWATNHSKRSVVVDLTTPEGRETFRRLAADADVVLESQPVGSLDAIGLGPSDLMASSPGLVVVSITPFGLDGPKARWAAHDLTVQASSGVMHLTGDADRAPLQQSSFPQAFLHAGLDAVVGALVALAGREVDGWGRHVDVSAQTSTMLCAQQCVLAEAWGDVSPRRNGVAIALGGVRYRVIYPALDGWVSISLFFGPTFGDYSRRLIELLCAERLVDPAVLDRDFTTFGVELREGRRPPEDLDELNAAIEAWTARRTRAELADLATSHRLLLVPVSTIADVRSSPQLAARDFFRTIEDASLGTDATVVVPGPFARFSATPLPAPHPAPSLGEHHPTARPARPRPARADAPRSRPLEGLRILDFTWVMAGPMAVRYLSDAGATVVHIESAARPDSARAVTPHADGKADPDTSGLHANLNCDKLALSLDMSVPESRDVVLRLVDWADVVVENYSPKAMRGWGIDYESLRRHRPDLVMVSSCLNGQTGPDAGLAGYGTMGAQIAGFGALAGWPDRDPVGPFGAYTDYCSPRFAAMGLLAALEHRRRTGEGQHVDLSQAEASLHLLGPALLDFGVNGHLAERCGNASAEVAPHGVYPCRGRADDDERWVAVVAATDEQFIALCRAIGRPDWAADPELCTAAGRLWQRARLDEGMTSWTSSRTPDEVENALQAAGVPAHRVLGPDDVGTDPQLAARHHFVSARHPVLGDVWVENSRLRISGADTTPRRAGLLIGEHNEQVLRDVLGLDPEQVAELHRSGALH
jgi:crotonobetainyl-CoA:carnitine CoA-transferase CaiB-like acyl-CoA transferase